ATAYCEGGSDRMTKYPCSLLIVLRSWPVPVCLMVTLADGMTAPEGSETVPTIVAIPCPDAIAAITSPPTATHKRRLDTVPHISPPPGRAGWTPGRFSPGKT